MNKDRATVSHLTLLAYQGGARSRRERVTGRQASSLSRLSYQHTPQGRSSLHIHATAPFGLLCTTSSWAHDLNQPHAAVDRY